MIKGDVGKIHYKALLRNYSRLIKYSFMEDGRKDRKPTEEVISWRMFPERSRWTRVVAVKGLALSDWERLFTPATMTRQTLVSISGTKMSSSRFSLKGPTAPSTCRTEVNQKHHSPKGSSRMVFWHLLKKNRLVSHRQLTEKNTEMESASFCSTSTGMEEDFALKS